MKRVLFLFFLLVVMIGSSGILQADSMIVFTANQSWFSRIYLLDMTGAVITWHEYEYYVFSDLAVVNNEVYVTDWVAPRLYRVDPFTGSLDVVVDDWNLLSMYDVAWDGNFFYIDEWDLNRYDLTGNYDSTADFDASVFGSAYDGAYYWTVVENGLIKCWDISGWPTVTEVPGNSFSAPSVHCRGLWFDGQYFWTAESIDDVPGNIYQFDADGTVISQVPAPAFKGFAACLIEVSTPTPTSPPCLNHGDVNFDGEITSADAQMTFMITLGSITPTFEEACAADCNGDGEVTSGDAQLIFMTALGAGNCEDPIFESA